MSAQQQLATLLAAPDEAHALFGDAALKFIRDHGPAIAELIEADIAIERWNKNQLTWFESKYRSERDIADAAREKRAAALRKLTQEA